MLLTQQFLSQYPDQPDHMNELASFVFYRTYSRWLPKEKRRETWKEAVARAVNYNIGIAYEQFIKNKYNLDEQQRRKMFIEAETLFDNIFNLRQFLSGRTHWVGGAETGVANKFPLANFNCSFVDVTKWNDLCDLFYLLLVGTGVGFRCSKENARKLEPIRVNYTLTHSSYNPLEPDERLERTHINDLKNGYAKIYVGDSKEGWVEALRFFFDIITREEWQHVKHIKISYNSIRPKGERLKTFGGTASGHLPLLEMFEGIDKVLKNKLDPALEQPYSYCHKQLCSVPVSEFQECHACSPWRKVRPIHVLDIGNLVGNNVVVGGVRRTAEIFICDNDDKEVISAKQGISSRPELYHRFMSNNSIAFEEKPTKEKLHEVFTSIRENGEPGFINMEAARKRRPNAKGLNPCGEVILDSYGVCNLTTVNMMAFVKPIDPEIQMEEGYVQQYRLDFQGLMQAQALSVRAGLRMTCVNLELPHWNEIQKRDRLIGCSLTGWKDAMSALGYDHDQENNLLDMLSKSAHDTAMLYSHILRIPTPLLATTIKPEGTLSQVAGGVSNGLHDNYAPFYIRRIRINASDPLVDMVKNLNWHIQPEVGQTWKDANTLVIDFPVKTKSTQSRDAQSAKEQLDTYFQFQECYTSHNSSNTIYVKDEEWDEVEQIVWDRWDDIIGITFLPYDGGGYELAPYEEITEEKYWELKEQMLPFDPQLLEETEAVNEELLVGSDCEGNACPIR